MHEGHRERMRDKLFTDADAVTDHELLEILLYYSISRKNTNPVAHELLDAFGSLAGVLSAPPALLGMVEGGGSRSAEFLSLIGAVYRRAARAEEAKRPRFLNFSAAQAFIESRFGDLREEKLELYCIGEDGGLLYLKTVNNARHDSVGADAGCIGFALSQVKPHGVILVHNHPSGDMHPSAQDDRSAGEIARVCRVHGVKFLDSIIYTKNGSFSYYCSGRLERLPGTETEVNGGNA